MSDLSNLLGSVYGDRNADAAPVRHEPSADERGPAWDDDARLDEAFQHWTPGPGPEAPAHEREMLGGPPAAYEIEEPADPDRDLAAALSAALAAETRTPHEPPHPQPQPQPSAAAPPYAAPAQPAPPVMPPPAPQPAMVAPAPAAPAPMPAPAQAAPAMPAMPKEQAFAAPMATPTMAAPGAPVASWQFGDDDIYPLGRRGKKR